MIIKKDSILLKLHETKIDEKGQLFFDALSYTMQTIDESYSRLCNLLDVEGTTDNSPAMREAWDIVDNLYRFKCILGIIPKVKRNLPWFQLTLRKIGSVEASRHFIEHYNGELQELYDKVQPLVGYIAFLTLTGNKQATTAVRVPGKLRNYKGLHMINPAGKTLHGKIDHITLFLGDNQVNLSEMYYQLETFAAELEKYIQNNFK